jgi:rhodanese-related sulfurtransferase
MKTYKDLVNECLPHIKELFPWDLEEKLQAGEKPLILDIREPYEFDAMHIKGAINVPRGILESACDYDYEETEPRLADGRDEDIVVVCRSGNRSALAACVMQQMGFNRVTSLKTGLRGWNDYELPLHDNNGKVVDIDAADEYFTPKLKPSQHKPKDNS